MKRTIRKILRALGYGVWKIESSEVLNFYNFLHLLLSYKGTFSYVQIGAHDGIMVDPMYEFVTDHSDRIRGVLVEPIPKLFSQLRSNYSAFPTIRPINVAIHNELAEATMYCLKDSAIRRMGEKSSGWASLDPDHWKRMHGLSETDIEAMTVTCKTLVEVLKENELTNPDVIIVDTEGYDFQLLADLDLDRIRPKIIRFEHGLSTKTMTENQLKILIAKFNSYGYQVILEQNDATVLDTNFAIQTFS